MKKKLLYASPFLPKQSGISDYSEILIYGLREYFDITLLIDDYKLLNKNLYKDFKVLIYKKDKIKFDEYDYKIYNIGNNPWFHGYIYDCALKYPGFIILHDFILYYLTIGYYQNKESFYSEMYEIAGANGFSLIKSQIKRGRNLLECKEISHLLPLNKELIKLSQGIFVHSEYTRGIILKEFKKADICKINMVDMNNTTDEKISNDYLRENYGVADDAVVIASFGYIAPTKQNHIICEVINDIAAKGKNIYYIMVGEGNYIDNYANGNIIKTGFVERNIYDSILKRCNIVANLRYPTMGETSISLIHAMGIGKPCFVTDDAWFSELPDDVVVKISYENEKKEIYEKLIYFLENQNQLKMISKKAKEFVKNEHSIEKIANDIYKFLNKI
ncbi:MAG: glycosyltransferase [Ignavibacteriales bacterium]